MKNNFCEEQTFEERVNKYHSKEVDSYSVPDWAHVDCPHCENTNLPASSIRNITCRLNARNIGDISVEIYCNKCEIMDSVYFRSQFTNMKEFSEFLDGTRSPDCEPVVEEKMYRTQYNNLVEKMRQEENKEEV
jgi:hypothetical protein